MLRRSIPTAVLGLGVIAIAMCVWLIFGSGSRIALSLSFASNCLGIVILSFLIRAQTPIPRAWAKVFGICAASLGAAVMGLGAYAIPRVSDPFFLIVGVAGLISCQLLLMTIALRALIGNGSLGG